MSLFNSFLLFISCSCFKWTCYLCKCKYFKSAC